MDRKETKIMKTQNKTMLCPNAKKCGGCDYQGIP